MIKPSDLDVWIMAGQSNMEGVGDLSEALEPNENVWAYSMKGEWGIAKDPLHPYFESDCEVYTQKARECRPPQQQALSNEELAQMDIENRKIGTSCGISFGTAIATATGKPIGLIPCALGGSSMNEWSPTLKDKGKASLYGALLSRVEGARQQGRVNIKGILWYQGESDAFDVQAALAYPEKMKTLICSLRRDLGIDNLPVALVQIGCVVPWENPFLGAEWMNIRYHQHDFPETIPHCRLTSAIDLGLSDGIHINSIAQHRLGKRLANLALRQAYGMNKYPQSPRIKAVEPAKTVREDVPGLRLVFENVTGGWQACNNIFGFKILNSQEQGRSDNWVINAGVCSDDSACIFLRLTSKPQKGDMLTYGHGLNLPCNAVDEADMPLCAFKWVIK